MNNIHDRKQEMCALCEREVGSVSRHHLVPKQAGGKHGETVPLCQPCHTTIHYTFSNKELAKDYNSIQKLQQAPELNKYLSWIRKRQIEKISNRRRN